ncbi:MAG: tetratricopeptide repeat protein [candidate division WOR-3 bacterium]|nr:MAG: tetratricopeptide repeat protein [candidate division WOR-3 bacterium]
MHFHFGINIPKLTKDQFFHIADTIERSWGRIDIGEKDLLIGSSKESNILCCLLQLKQEYPEARFGFSQHVALARGLSKIAEKGEILISEEIEKIVIDDFNVTCLGMLSIQGLANEILVCRLEKPTKDVKPPKQKPAAPHISRRSQIESLEHHLTVTKALLVVCPTGGGKTAFFDEIVDQWRDQKIIYRTACPSYMRGITFQPITDLVVQVFEIDTAGNIEEKQKRIEQKLKELKIVDIATSYLSMLDFLSLSDEESILEKIALTTRVEVLTDTVADIIKRISWSKPVVLITEDAENMDASSTIFMQQLMTKLAEEDVSFIFCSYLSHTNLSGLQEFELQEIVKKDLSKLVEETIGETMTLPPTTPFHVMQYIRLYNEEKLSYLYRQYQGETSIAGFALSYHDLKTIIKRRFEILNDKKNFISNLTIAGVKIRPDEFPLEEGNTELFGYFVRAGYLMKRYDYYIFANPILHDELYELAANKKNMHLRFADYYSRISGHEEQAAFHYRKAKNYRKAIEFLMKSAKQAVRKGGYESGIAYYNQALELCQRKRDAAELELVIALNEGLADVHRALGEEDKALKYYKVVLDSYKEILKE